VQQAASGIDRRNLRGRCGGSRVWKRELPGLRHDEPVRMLASSGTGIEVRNGKRGACFSIAKLPPTREERRDEGPTAGDQRGERETRPPRAGFPGGAKHPDCRDGAPLRGGSRDGDLGRYGHAEGLQPSGISCPPRRPQGARPATEEGNLTLLSHGSSAGGTGVPSLRANRPTSAHRHCLTHPRRNRRWARGVASHAASRRAVALVAPPFGRLALPTDGIHGVAWLAACLSSKEGGLSHAVRFEQGRAGSGGQRIGTGARQRALPPARARIGRSRSCSRVVDVVAEVDRQWPAQRSGRSPSHPIWTRSGTGA
jgi:hypothetical protein